MMKKFGVLFLVVVLMISFSTVIFAQADEAAADIDVNIEQGSGTIEFVDATNAAEPNENASDTGKEHPKNPITVAGS
ncbi:MAG: hypothetical protein U5K53_00050 [Halanaerobiales bacterium]|nr:hypothetical protein [Halanaerobiales bacterium]